MDDNTNEVLNNDIEVAFLSALLINSYEIAAVRGQVKPEMLASVFHQHIYRAMCLLADKALATDDVMVATVMRDNKTLDLIGGMVYLEYLKQKNGNPKNLQEYCMRIQDNYKVRYLQTINSRLPDVLKKRNVNEIISQLSGELNKLVSSVGGADTILLTDALDDVLLKIEYRMAHPGIEGISTGFGEIDMCTGGLLPGEIWYIGGRPSMGKSAWLAKTLLNVAMQGAPCLLFNKEMNMTGIIERWLSIASGVPFQGIKFGQLNSEQYEKIKHIRKMFEKYPIYIDNNFMGEIDYVTSTIRKYHQLHGVRVVGLDYIQLLVERGEDDTRELGRVSRQLKLVSNELGLSTIILSQLNREVEKRDNKRPMMSDLRQSGNLEEDADIMAALYRDDVYVMNSQFANTIEFIIRKSRNGPIGTMMLNFEKETVNVYDETGVANWEGEA